MIIYFIYVGAMDEKYLQNRSVNMTLIDHKSKRTAKEKRENIFPDEARDYVLIF